MKKDLPGDTEIYVELKTYLYVKEYLEHSYSRWMNEFSGYVFYSIKDYFEKLDEANKNRLFWDMPQSVKKIHKAKITKYNEYYTTIEHMNLLFENK